MGEFVVLYKKHSAAAQYSSSSTWQYYTFKKWAIFKKYNTTIELLGLKSTWNWIQIAKLSNHDDMSLAVSGSSAAQDSLLGWPWLHANCKEGDGHWSQSALNHMPVHKFPLFLYQNFSPSIQFPPNFSAHRWGWELNLTKKIKSYPLF